MEIKPSESTMETRLQSNEVRIPKPEFDLKGVFTCPDPQNQHYFKSSFARSLSNFGSSPQSKSLDFTINYGYPQPSRFAGQDGQVSGDEGTLLYNTLLESPLSMPPMYNTRRMRGEEEEEVDVDRRNDGKPVTEQSTESLASSSSVATVVPNVWTSNAQTVSSSSATSSSSSVCNGGVGKVQVNRYKYTNGVGDVDCGGIAGKSRPTLRKLHQLHKSASVCDSTEIEVLRLRKECQNLIEENRRLLNLAGVTSSEGGGAAQHASTVEAVILQSHVETLQWQLKQVESSRQMYRAVMEEVVRFLERCHQNLETLVVEEPIVRSKSSHHVHQDADSSQLSNCSDNDQSLIASPSPPPGKSGLFTASRLRCSTIDAPKLFNRHLSSTGINSTLQTAGSYTNFRDFTWRRNRKPLNRTHSSMDTEPEKLSQEAFRLLRTANNLLNTHEPSLVMPKSIFDSPMTSPHLTNQSLNSSFCRKSNGRHSNTSMRSCCDMNSTSSNSSGASTASSSQKAPLAMDIEDMHLESDGGKVTNGNSSSHPVVMVHSEAESGFSSISSFQEIGLPLVNSTLLSYEARSNRMSSNVSNSDESNTECDLTLQAGKEEVPPILPKRSPMQSLNHRRWDSAPALPPKKSNALHAFHGSGQNEESSLRVLWV